MKKVFALMFAASLFTMVSCGEKKAESTEGSSETTTTETMSADTGSSMMSDSAGMNSGSMMSDSAGMNSGSMMSGDTAKHM